jgi:quercetin dioxygenase-like cupin family protein
MRRDRLLSIVTVYSHERPGMPSVSIVGSKDGEEVLSGAIQIRIVEDGSSTDHRIGMAVITIAPHTDGPPQHWHAKHDEGFYVVSGTVRFTVGETQHDAPAGTLVMLPPGAEHTFANASEETAVLLNTFTPDFYVGFFRDMRDYVSSGKSLSDEVIVEMMSRYATYPAGKLAPPAAT